MNAEEIAHRLLSSPKGTTPEREAKAKALAQRSKVSWESVQAAIKGKTDE